MIPRKHITIQAVDIRPQWIDQTRALTTQTDTMIYKLTLQLTPAPIECQLLLLCQISESFTWAKAPLSYAQALID